MNKETDKYHRWVAWSEDDQVYVGRCPDLFLGGVHGDEPINVARQLQELIDEWETEHHESSFEFPPARVKPMMEVA
jgi:hypothetical protein